MKSNNFHVAEEEYVKIFVGSIPKHITHNEIREKFMEFGIVQQVFLMKDLKYGGSKGCCFIRYPTRAEADTAIAKANGSILFEGQYNACEARLADGEQERLDNKLFVGKLAPTTNQDDLIQLFSEYGTVTKTHIMLWQDGTPKGGAFVHLSTKQGALRAIEELNGKLVLDDALGPIKVDFAERKDQKQLRQKRGVTHTSYAPPENQISLDPPQGGGGYGGESMYSSGMGAGPRRMDSYGGMAGGMGDLIAAARPTVGGGYGDTSLGLGGGMAGLDRTFDQWRAGGGGMGSGSARSILMSREDEGLGGGLGRLGGSGLGGGGLGAGLGGAGLDRAGLGGGMGLDGLGGAGLGGAGLGGGMGLDGPLLPKPPLVQGVVQPPPPPTLPTEIKLYVAGLPLDYDNGKVWLLFKKFGAVEDVYIMNKEKSPGCAFVKFVKEDSAVRAINEMHGKKIADSKDFLTVRFASNKSKGQAAPNVGVGENRFRRPLLGGGMLPHRPLGPSQTPVGGAPKLFVGGIPEFATEVDVADIFQHVGPVTEVFMKRKDDGRHGGYAFVRFGSKEHAAQAISTLNESYYMPGSLRPLQVKVATGEPDLDVPGLIGAGTSGPKRPASYPEDPAPKIFIGGLPFQMTYDELKHLASQYGKVIKVFIMRKPDNTSRGAGFVIFSRKYESDNFIREVDGYQLPGSPRPLQVRYAEVKEEDESGDLNPQKKARTEML